ncbi:hypothetical protein AB1M95_10930 [Sulfitobacter sp. LCG007]
MEEARFSVEEAYRIARLARRRPGSEAALIFGAGGAVLFVLSFWFGPYLALPLSELTGLPLPAIALTVSFGLSTLLSLVHAKTLSKRVQAAQRQDAEVKYAFARCEQSKKTAAIEKMQKERGE